MTKSPYCFDSVHLIYNPNSTGDAPGIAKETYSKLVSTLDTIDVTLRPTEHAGHAEEIAKDIALKHTAPLIVAISGDGGYHEVVNGAIAAQQSDERANPILAVIGAGNANDHYNVVHKRPLIDALKSEPVHIDLLRVSMLDDGKTTIRHAHSYAGIGFSPRIAQELNKYKLNIIKEAQILFNALVSERPVRIISDGIPKKIESLLFANISRMAKILTLDDNNSLHDGQFEVVEIAYKNRLNLLRTLIKAAASGLKNQPKHTVYSFVMAEDMPIQIDGEIIECKIDTEVRVDVTKDAIRILR